MTRRWRFPVILALSIVFGAPVLSELALASGDLMAAGVRYLAALGLSWMGVSAIGRMMDSYAAHNAHVRRRAEAEQQAALAEREARSLPQSVESLEAMDSAAEGATAAAMS